MPDYPEPPEWTQEEVAEFHLNNAMAEEDYRWAIQEVLSMGIDPLALDPAHLFQNDAPWRNLALYPDLLVMQRSR